MVGAGARRPVPRARTPNSCVLRAFASAAGKPQSYIGWMFAACFQRAFPRSKMMACMRWSFFRCAYTLSRRHVPYVVSHTPLAGFQSRIVWSSDPGASRPSASTASAITESECHSNVASHTPLARFASGSGDNTIPTRTARRRAPRAQTPNSALGLRLAGSRNLELAVQPTPSFRRVGSFNLEPSADARRASNVRKRSRVAEIDPLPFIRAAAPATTVPGVEPTHEHLSDGAGE